eukprot:1990562-Rhodomonas_salina.7
MHRTRCLLCSQIGDLPHSKHTLLIAYCAHRSMRPHNPCSVIVPGCADRSKTPHMLCIVLFACCAHRLITPYIPCHDWSKQCVWRLMNVLPMDRGRKAKRGANAESPYLGGGACFLLVASSLEPPSRTDRTLT